MFDWRKKVDKVVSCKLRHTQVATIFCRWRHTFGSANRRPHTHTNKCTLVSSTLQAEKRGTSSSCGSGANSGSANSLENCNASFFLFFFAFLCTESVAIGWRHEFNAFGLHATEQALTGNCERSSDSVNQSTVGAHNSWPSESWSC